MNDPFELIINAYWATLGAIAIVAIGYYIASLGSNAQERVRVRAKAQKSLEGQKKSSKEQ